jgi:AraC-like DNA-binding protein
MILSRKKLEYKGQAIIEKLVIAPPHRYEANFQNEGCFVYVSGSEWNVKSPSEEVQMGSNEAVLLKCDSYFVDFIRRSKSEKAEVYTIHLVSWFIKNLYRIDLPEIVKEAVSEKKVDKIIPEGTTAKFIDSLQFYFDNPVLVNNDLIELKIKELILLLLQNKKTDSIRQIFIDLFSPRKANLKRVIQTHLYSNLSVAELAKLCNLSLSSFKREFKKIFLESPSRYIITQRLNRSAELLKLSPKNVSEIAYEAGFHDPSYFTRLFKKEFGIPPTKFRDFK